MRIVFTQQEEGTSSMESYTFIETTDITDYGEQKIENQEKI